MADDAAPQAIAANAHRSVFAGRPRSLPSARRFVTAQRDRALLRLWRSAPEAVGYLAGVIRGREEFQEGKYKAAVQILSRCLPTVTAQQVTADTTSMSVAAIRMVNGRFDQESVETRAKAIIAEIMTEEKPS